MYDIKSDVESSNVLCIIGRAEYGKVLEPYYVESYTETINEFKSGEMVNMFKFAYSLNVDHIYLIRVNYDTDRDKYYSFKRAYEVLDIFKPNIVYPMNVKTDESILNYNEIFYKEQHFILDISSDEIKIEKNIFFIEKLKINGISPYNYIVEGNIIKLPKSIPAGSEIEIVYYSYEDIEFQLDIICFQDKNIKETKKINLKYNPYEDKDKEIGKPLKDYFDFSNEKYFDTYNIGDQENFDGFFDMSKNIEVIDNVIKPKQDKSFMLSPTYNADLLAGNKVEGVKFNIDSNIKYFNDYVRPYDLPAFDLYFIIDDEEFPVSLESLEQITKFDKNITDFAFGIETHTDKLEIYNIEISFLVEGYPQNLSYMIKDKYDYANFYSSIEGDNPITVDIDLDNYWKNNMRESYFFDFIIDQSIHIGCLNVMEGLTKLDENYALNFQNFLKRRKEHSSFIVSCLSDCFYKGIDKHLNSAGLIAANMAITHSNVSMTNNRLLGVGSFHNYNLSSNRLSNEGYCLLKETIRNGIVLHRGLTLGINKGHFYTIKDLRVALEFKNRWDLIVNRRFIGNSKHKEKIMQDELENLLGIMQKNRKINDFKFEYLSNKDEFRVELKIDHEIDSQVFDLFSNLTH